jgi:uncharacterized protein (TIGR03437 family)
MQRLLCRVGLGLGLPWAVFAQIPKIYTHGVTNAASYTASGLPTGAVALGSIFTIFGTNLGPANGVQVSSFPLGTTFNGVAIKVTQGSTTVNALPLYVSQSSINAIMPSNAPLGLVSLRLTFNGLPSNPIPVRVVNDSAGIFTFTGTGLGPAAALIALDSGLTNNSTANTAQPGQIITLFVTGLGPISAPENVAPPKGNLPTPVEVFVGGVSASVQYSGRSSFAGLDQINFAIPGNAPQGCWVPMYVRTSHTSVSNVVTMSIGPHNGAACTEPSNPLANVFVNGGKLAEFTVARFSVLEDVATIAPVEVASDIFGIEMSQEKGGPFAFAPFLSLPPAGTCTVFTTASDFFTNGALAVNSTSVRPLDAGGPFSLTGPNGTVPMTATNPAVAAGYLGSFAPYLPSLPNQLVLNPGSFTIKAPGGADVKAFSAAFNILQPFTWSNRSQTTTVDRTLPLTITWSGAPAQSTMAVFGASADLPANASAIFYCIATPGATSFTVPPDILSVLPPSHGDFLKSKSVIFIGNTPASNATPVSIPGIDAAVVGPTLVLGKTVVFK